jgi:hypothetical protein
MCDIVASITNTLAPGTVLFIQLIPSNPFSTFSCPAINMDADGLRSVRNAFYLGLYPEVAKEVAQLSKADKELQGQ